MEIDAEKLIEKLVTKIASLELENAKLLVALENNSEREEGE